jgi:2-C-methyl-D-erythritol 4-phosphate cytidylyltransferase
MKTGAIIAAGGAGLRLGHSGGKQLLHLCGKPVAAWAIEAVAAAQSVDELVVVCDPRRLPEYARELSAAITTDKPLMFVPGGAERSDSIRAGLAALEAPEGIVVIHDGARPLLEPTVVDQAVALLQQHAELAGVVVGHPVSDTLKQKEARVSCDTPGTPADQVLISGTVDRSAFWQVQTPQVFRLPALRSAYEHAAREGIVATDDAALLEHEGHKLALLRGSRNNIKITEREDIELAETLLRARQEK